MEDQNCQANIKNYHSISIEPVEKEQNLPFLIVIHSWEEKLQIQIQITKWEKVSASHALYIGLTNR